MTPFVRSNASFGQHVHISFPPFSWLEAVYNSLCDCGSITDTIAHADNTT